MPTVRRHASRSVRPVSRSARRSGAGIGIGLVVLLAATMALPVGVAAVDNVPPTALDDPGTACFPSDFGGSFPIPEDSSQTVFTGRCSAIANDTDPDGSIVGWQIVDLPTHGSLSYLATNPTAFGYTPEHDWSTPAGTWLSDSFTYRAIDDDGAASNLATMRFWVAPFNDAPTFTPGPSVVSSPPNTPYEAAWATNVSPGPPNEAGQTVQFEQLFNSNPGLFASGPTIAPDGTLSFTPAAGRQGFTTITVDAKDDGGLEHYLGIPDQADDTSDPVTFQIRIEVPNNAPTAVDDTATIAEDSGAGSIPVLSNDSDPDRDPLTVLGVSAAGLGSVAVTPGGGSVTYTPNANANGSDSFTYTISDGHGHTATATVHLTITPVPDPPSAVDDVATTAEDAGPITIAVLSNDSDSDQDPLTVIGVSGAGLGSVAIIPGGGAVTYAPNADANGVDSFSYTISDGNGHTASASVTVTISPVNDPPDAVDDGTGSPVRIGKGVGAIAIPVLANDSFAPDADESLTIVSVTQGAHGAVAIGADGTSLTYDPAGQWSGSDAFTYTISDGHGATDTATVQVEVGKDATAPVTSAPVVAAAQPAGAGLVRLTVTWTAEDPESSIASTQLQIRRDDDSWSTVTLTSPAATQADVVVPIGRTYTFRVRASNGATPTLTSGYVVGTPIAV